MVAHRLPLLLLVRARHHSQVAYRSLRFLATSEDRAAREARVSAVLAMSTRPLNLHPAPPQTAFYAVVGIAVALQQFVPGFDALVVAHPAFMITASSVLIAKKSEVKGRRNASMMLAYVARSITPSLQLHL